MVGTGGQTYLLRPHRYDPDESLSIAQAIEGHYDPRKEDYIGLSHDQQIFIQNEILISRCDFRYFVRYLRVLAADAEGKERPMALWGVQTRLLDRIGTVEMEMYQQLREGRKSFAGNCWYMHKAGQRGVSTICQALGVHLTNFYSGINSLAASTNEDKVKELYQNYGAFMWSRLPKWMHTKTTSDTQATGKIFETGSKFVLQNADQNTGLGQGAKWHWSHLTECASWDRNRVMDQIENHYMPRVHFAWGTMAFLESTSQGFKDWWHQATERARAGRFDRWRYFFVPWYAVPEVTYAYPPLDWSPSPDTLAERDLIERTSPEWMDGQTYRLSLSEMYYWETIRRSKEENGALAEFYKNYPSTPEQSFVSGGRSSFPMPVILTCERDTRTPHFYDILGEVTSADRFLDPYTDNLGKWDHYTVDGVTIAPVRTTPEEQADVRGLIQLFDPPDARLKSYHTYAGIDTADGAIDWNRFLRRKEDDDLDNASIQIIRHAVQKDVQLASFKAPITPKQLARYFNILGRLYAGGNSVEDQIPTIVELTAGGKSFQEEMMYRYSWINWYEHHNLKGMEQTETGKLGWVPSGISQRVLWAFGKQRICDAFTLIRSISTVNEMRACKDDWLQVGGMIRGKAKKGYHDDDVYALMLALWYANDPANPLAYVSRPQSQVSQGKEFVPPHLRSWLPEQRKEYWEDWDDKMLSEPTPEELAAYFERQRAGL